jgi:hypothetical protein
MEKNTVASYPVFTIQPKLLHCNARHGLKNTFYWRRRKHTRPELARQGCPLVSPKTLKEAY